MKICGDYYCKKKEKEVIEGNSFMHNYILFLPSPPTPITLWSFTKKFLTIVNGPVYMITNLRFQRVGFQPSMMKQRNVFATSLYDQVHSCCSMLDLRCRAWYLWMNLTSTLKIQNRNSCKGLTRVEAAATEVECCQSKKCQTGAWILKVCQFKWHA